MRIAILDDYQNVALTMADWSPVKAKADLTVFQDHVKDLDRLVERLGDFEAIVIEAHAFPSRAHRTVAEAEAPVDQRHDKSQYRFGRRH